MWTREKASAWRKRNQSKIRKYQRTWKMDNRDRIKAHANTHYRIHRKSLLAKSSKRDRDKRNFLHWLKSQPCSDCSKEFPPVCMDFHHIRGRKVGEVSRMLRLAWKTLVTEVRKCEVICSNCHRLRTHGGV